MSAMHRNIIVEHQDSSLYDSSDGGRGHVGTPRKEGEQPKSQLEIRKKVIKN